MLDFVSTTLPGNPIRPDRQDGVATITLDRPESRNALTPSLFQEPGALFDEVERADDMTARIQKRAGNYQGR